MALQKIHIHFSKKEDIEHALDEMLAFTENMDSFKKGINSDDEFQWIFYPLDDAPLFTIEEDFNKFFLVLSFLTVVVE